MAFQQGEAAPALGPPLASFSFPVNNQIDQMGGKAEGGGGSLKTAAGWSWKRHQTCLEDARKVIILLVALVSKWT